MDSMAFTTLVSVFKCPIAAPNRMELSSTMAVLINVVTDNPAHSHSSRLSFVRI